MTPDNQMFWGQAVMALYPAVTYMTDWGNAWDKDNNPVIYDSALVEPKANDLMVDSVKQANKTQAMALLQLSDWTATADISDPNHSDPYLTNQVEFFEYRSTLRGIAVNPPTTPVTDWPTSPEEQWSN